MIWKIWIRSLLIALHRVLYCYVRYHCFYVLKEKLGRLLSALVTLQSVHIFPLCDFSRHYNCGWYTLWKELQQLQSCEQQHKLLKTDDLLVQTPPPHEVFITEVREQWIQTPFAEQATSFQDLRQDFQVSNAEYSLDLHVPNVSLERIHSPPGVHNDRAFTEFINGKERCLKFINQDLMFLQVSHIPLTFANIPHTPTQLKESLCITLPTHISKENNNTSCTQTVQPTLGFTPAEICRTQNEPTLMVPQLLESNPVKTMLKPPYKLWMVYM